MLRRSASIPKTIGYISYGLKEFNVGSYYDFKNGKTVQAHSSAVTDDPKSIVSCNKNVNVKQNDPIKNAKIINSHQVLIDGKYVTDIHSELVADLIVNSKLDKGVIKDPLIWCKIGSKIQLVRVNSSLYKEVASAESRKKLKKIRSKDFEIGGVYSTPAGKTAVYLGNIDAQVGLIDYQNVSNVQTKLIKNQKLFYYVSSTASSIDVDSINKWSLNIKPTHSFVEKTHTIQVDDNIISMIRESFIKKFKDYLVNYSKNRMGSNHAYMNNSVYWEYRYVCGFMSMVKSGEPLVQKFDLNKYLMLS